MFEIKTFTSVEAFNKFIIIEWFVVSNGHILLKANSWQEVIFRIIFHVQCAIYKPILAKILKISTSFILHYSNCMRVAHANIY